MAKSCVSSRTNTACFRSTWGSQNTNYHIRYTNNFPSFIRDEFSVNDLVYRGALEEKDTRGKNRIEDFRESHDWTSSLTSLFTDGRCRRRNWSRSLLFQNQLMLLISTLARNDLTSFFRYSSECVSKTGGHEIFAADIIIKNDRIVGTDCFASFLQTAHARIKVKNT